MASPAEEKLEFKPENSSSPEEQLVKFSAFVEKKFEKLQATIKQSHEQNQKMHGRIEALQKQVTDLKEMMNNFKESSAKPKKVRTVEKTFTRSGRGKKSPRVTTAPRRTRPLKTRRPVGRAPKGKKWDYDNGTWVDIEPEEAVADKKPTGTTSRPGKKNRRRGDSTEKKHVLSIVDGNLKKEMQSAVKRAALANLNPRKRPRVDTVPTPGSFITPSAPSPSYYKRPRGAPPKGKTWNYRTGEWIDGVDNDEDSAAIDKDYLETQAMILAAGGSI
eukprot:CAMPEP_0167794072 /NCGR_PEP_ID=MMETSP0111_2-20121227/13595_1 /TAXON_ID=91324 /ORGANISM="Lotharella globosa, Strain CCCM811" /LENGTH=273 /DNA_ID=CAMNT_0007687425 /DNA_START=65 /DNA_END=886 /DNA_ORIENTATION=+